MRHAVFMDRDGTIIVEKGYAHKPEDLELIPGSAESIRRLNELGFLVIVVTNQAGVARGYYGEEQVRLFHENMDRVLGGYGARIDAYYFCPHHAEYGEMVACGCRKPAPGMILQAVADFNVDIAGSYMIGDKTVDMQAAIAAGVFPVMVATGYGREQKEQAPHGI
ncbi:MAG: D-glycero-beta-D-manno-heptose 1,7-bisphosphate 7-phosphatase, partial [Nitrospinae bacterium]|nr:D-glycero-beta-D-manno-heptose 1,7-bisphosphate 7-phosphatase [Nitrospinota bacterium]